MKRYYQQGMMLCTIGLLAVSGSAHAAPGTDSGRVETLLLRPKQYRNAVSLEVLGNGGFYSLNYERAVLSRVRWQLIARIGGSYIPPDWSIGGYTATVLLKSVYRIRAAHHAVLGLGYLMDDATVFQLSHGSGELRDALARGFLTSRIGYRYQKPLSRWSYRIAFTPAYGFAISEGLGHKGTLYPMAGLGIGYSF